MTPPNLTALIDQLDRTVELNLPLLRSRDADAAREIDVLRQAVAQTPAVVVVGEQKRGKSSVINALLGVAGLSPVDIEVATSAYLVFRHGEQLRAVAHFLGEHPSREVDVSELRDWATALGTLPADLPPPRWVEVWHPSPLLEGLVLVDTPGVGGLDPGHAAAALEAVGLAAALLFVVDASGPFMTPELEFLRQTTRQVKLTLFALTKKDKYQAWPEILQENRANLAAQVPALVSAPWYEVSSRLALAASPGIVAQSGIAELRAAVAGVAAHGLLLRHANVLQAVRSHFDRLGREATRLAAAVDPDPVARLRAEQEMAEEDARVNRVSQDVNLAIGREITTSQAAATHRLGLVLRELDNRFQAQIQQADTQRMKELPNQLEGAVQAALAELTEQLSVEFAAVARRALAELVSPEETNEIVGRLSMGLAEQRLSRTMSQDNVDTTFNLITSIGAFSSISGVAAMMLGGLTVVPVALGVGAMLFVSRMRRSSADRTAAARWLSQSLGDLKADVTTNLVQQYADLRHALQATVADSGRRRREELASRVSEMRRAEAAGQQDRAERKKQLLADQRSLAERAGQLGSLLNTVTATVNGQLRRPRNS